jgi:hypothetical protein
MYRITNPVQPDDQLDWNKLPGVSDCGQLDLAQDGFMFAWRWRLDLTPNVLELQSRLRYVLTGFWNLYQPPSIDPANAGRLCGHVMPLHLAYYDFGLRRAGFVDATYHADRRRRGAQVLYALLWPLIAWRRARFAREVERYDPAVHAENRAVLSLINGPLVMTSRSLMFCARKPGAAPGPSEPGAVV